MIKTDLPVIILKGIVLLPNNDIRLEFENDLSKNIIDVAELFHDNKILIVSKEDPLEESMDLKELPNIGVIAKISHKIELPNGKTRLIITGIKRAYVHEYLNLNKKDDILESIVSEIEVEKIESKEEEALIKKLYRELEHYTKTIPYISNGFLSLIVNMTNLDKMTDIVVPYLQITQNRMLEYLYQEKSIERLKMIIKDIYMETENFYIEKEIDTKVTEDTILKATGLIPEQLKEKIIKH